MFLYILFTELLFFFFRPFILAKFKGKERLERLGKIKHEFTDSIWIHTNSVSEINSTKELILKLLNDYPKKQFVLSTLTKRGQILAKTISPRLIAFYVPLDIPHLMNRIFKRVNPSLIFLVETDFLPNMLLLAKRKKIPVIIINGKISDKKISKLRKLRFFWKPLWKNIESVNARSEKDAQRFRNLNFKNVKNTHNLKFCINLPKFNRETLRVEFGYKNDDFVIGWGSSREGEEKLLLKIYPKLLSKIPNLKLIIVPRYIHRSPKIIKIFKNYKCVTYSEMIDRENIAIIDEMEILNTFYALADLAIVGGSFFKFGGHNPLEPAHYGVPIIIGNHYNSYRDSVEILLENNAILIANKKNLADKILTIYDDKLFANKIGKNAQNSINHNALSLTENLQSIKKYL